MIVCDIGGTVNTCMHVNTGDLFAPVFFFPPSLSKNKLYSSIYREIYHPKIRNHRRMA